MSSNINTDDAYLAAIAAYYGSIESNLERIALDRGYVTRNGTVNINRLAEESGVSTSTLWYLLRDKRKFRAWNLVTLSKLCHTLNATPGELLMYVPGGTAAGLGYSSDAFQALKGFKQAASQEEEYAGANLGSEATQEGDA